MRGRGRGGGAEGEGAGVGKHLVHHQHGFAAVVFELGARRRRVGAGEGLGGDAFAAGAGRGFGPCALQRGACAAEEGGVGDAEERHGEGAEEALRAWELLRGRRLSADADGCHLRRGDPGSEEMDSSADVLRHS